MMYGLLTWISADRSGHQYIVINAKQAMPSGGKIDVSAVNVFLVKNQIPPLSSGRYTKISFTDYGVGIPADNISRIFDPYFTTKAEGSGMGLTSTYSILKKHGGYIQVNSEVNKGTTFYVYLPASDGTSPRTMTPPEGIVIGKGKVLLMDDEEIIRESTGELIRNLGYNVECAADGENALTKFIDARRKGDPFRRRDHRSHRPRWNGWKGAHHRAPSYRFGRQSHRFQRLFKGSHHFQFQGI